MKFPTGSIVTLKSGGPPMTVTAADSMEAGSDYRICSWFVGGDLRDGEVHVSCLEAADQPNGVIGAEHDIIIDRQRLADVGRRITTALRAQDPLPVLWVDLLAELESACRGDRLAAAADEALEGPA